MQGNSLCKGVRNKNKTRGNFFHLSNARVYSSHIIKCRETLCVRRELEVRFLRMTSSFLRRSSLIRRRYNRPFYRYGGHLEFRGNYGMPRGQMRNN